jgi:hypothetical protein
MSSKHFISVAALCAAAGTSTTALAQWIPNYQTYSIQRIGLYGPEHTDSVGLQSSTAQFFNASGNVAGTSTRYRGAGMGTGTGTNTWVWNGTTTIPIGLTGPEQTSSEGTQVVQLWSMNSTGQVSGYSNRYNGTAYNGRDAWVWNGTTTTLVGLTGPGYTTSAGYQDSFPTLLNNAGQVAGFTEKSFGVNNNNGTQAWVWNGTTTTPVGLTGPAHVTNSGYLVSLPLFQNDAGQVVGTSRRYRGDESLRNGADTWAWNGSTSVQIGLVGGPFTSPIRGYQFSEAKLQNRNGQVAGISNRYTGVNAELGGNAGGWNLWVWNGTTTTMIGLTGAPYVGSDGYQTSQLLFQNNAGLVVGTSGRYTGVNSGNGSDAWVWNGTTTTQIGLLGPAYTGTGGYRASTPRFLNESGQTVGTTSRIRSAAISNGQDTWVWNGVTTTQIGLVGGSFTGSAGYQLSLPQFQNEAGQVVGYSRRFTGVNTDNGQSIWVWNGTTTTQIGLTGPAYTGSAGRQNSSALFMDAAGRVAGTSARYVGEFSVNGSDAWYFDPSTLVTSAVIGSVRTSDNFASSTPTIITDGGFLLGIYTFFPGGLGSGEARAFIFRPDLGLTDLGNLVSGGLTLNGWSTLQNPLFADALNTIVGYGYVNGQTTGQSVFVMVPTPSAAALLTLGGLLACRRRRR